MAAGFFIFQKVLGSLPSFIAAFTSRKKLTNEEVREIQQMIDMFNREG
ncbi:MAG: hypothetical protein IJ711_05355 [Lachnospiraceae bacterium]|nr:hypothetical protein [Lachnospiraceae bacterium]